MNDYTWQFIIAIAAVTGALVFVFRLYVKRVEAENKRVWELYRTDTTRFQRRIAILEGEVTKLNRLITSILAKAAGIDIGGGGGDDGR